MEDKKLNVALSREAELENCTFVKTVLMIIVVLYHSILYWGGSWFVGEPVYEVQALAVIAQWFNSFHIYAFAFVSGYLFSYLRLERNKYTDFGSLCLNKTKRLLIPYAFVSLVWVIPFAVVFYKYGIIDIVKKFVLGLGPSQLWFLLMLFGVSLITGMPFIDTSESFLGVTGKAIYFLTWALFNLAFVAYDFFLLVMIRFYQERIRPKIKNLLK